MAATVISQSGFLHAYDYESISVGATAVGLTASKIQPTSNFDRGKARMVFITCEDIVRYRIDGADPTSSEGHELRDGDSLTLNAESQMRAIKFIKHSDATGDPKLRVTYFR